MMKLNPTSGGATPVITAAAFCLTLLPGAASAVSLGQVDDFEDGTTQFWKMGLPVNVSNITTGGPAGVGDNYLQSIGDGSGAGSKITVFNGDQWSGNYTTAGVNTISVDLNNFSSDPLTIRLGLLGDGGKFVTTSGFSLAASSGWMTAVFSIAAGDLTSVSDGTSGAPGTDVDLTLATVGHFRFINSADPSWTGNVPIGLQTLGIDNITATVTAVPLPAAFWLFGSGLLGLIGISRRKNAA